MNNYEDNKMLAKWEDYYLDNYLNNDNEEYDNQELLELADRRYEDEVDRELGVY